ncbi:calpain-6 isoform X1 [Serinus canaria]|uniref:Calpain 6 n=1 Tax=Serinus canaria TaxID=9135 RepID=A0A8C9NVI2_SERCA|nr:calpain-6 isoform X1 [Serinus canaria]XP_030084770.2 calpain-6 isoform X1 [Serinus canaria]
MSSSVHLFRDQRYQELKGQCLQQGILFEDPEFPASDESLYYDSAAKGKVEWKRPKDLCEDPHLLVDGMSSHDFHQGKLGNCWFVAACSCLALRKSLWQQVIPDSNEQEWDPKSPRKYAGIFRFRFWRFGEWTEVVVDDQLPTENGELIYCRSNVRNEFWSALLEKAYAKLAGSYQALDGGCAAEALVDFTGAVAESINLEEGKYGEVISEQMKLFEDLMKVHKRGGFISCSISESPGRPSEAETGTGLIVGHAYSVTAIRKLRLGESLVFSFKAEKLFMIRLRNPWGKKEWHGAWSDSSEEWKKVSDSERKSLGLTVGNDGEFWTGSCRVWLWAMKKAGHDGNSKSQAGLELLCSPAPSFSRHRMTFEDWCKNFTDVDICRTVNTSCFSLHKTWEKEMIYGAWAKHPEPLLNRSGGCFDNRETFLQNPQYLFDVKKAQDKVLVSLQQEDRRKYKKEGKGDNITIGFEILKVEDNRRYRLHKLTVQERVATSPYSNTRSVFLRRTLQQGRYVLVPTTYIPGVPTKFILRLYTDVPSKLRELKADRPKMTCWSLLCGYPRRVTQIKVHSAEGLQKQDRSGGADPYVLIKCENQSRRSPVQHDTTSPVFNTQVIFYRKDIDSPVTIQVWNSNLLRDQFLGQAVLAASPGEPREQQRLKLRGRGGGEAAEVPGHISVTVLCSDDLGEL